MAIVFLVAGVIATRSHAQEHDAHASETPVASSSDHTVPSSATPEVAPTNPSKEIEPRPNLSDTVGWPEPVDDQAIFWFLLFDQLEYQRLANLNALRWDVTAWAGDKNRIWLKSSADLYFSAPVGGQVDLQLLYGRLISPFFDLQVGGRIEQHNERTATPRRGFLALAVQGLAPGGFEVAPQLFLSNKLKVSGRLNASVDFLLTQRLVLRLQFESEFAFQRDEEFGVDPGINDLEGGARLRYELCRELAPYVGVAYRASLGATRERVLREGGASNTIVLAAGVRTWF